MPNLRFFTQAGILACLLSSYQHSVITITFKPELIMDRLKRMSIYAQVVESGSFTAAARRLDMSVSSISQTVAKLENELQVKLLNRSTRSIGLTEAGKIYYQGCRRMLVEFN